MVIRIDGPVVMVGGEASVALACAMRNLRPDMSGILLFFEAENADYLGQALINLNLPESYNEQRVQDDFHLLDLFKAIDMCVDWPEVPHLSWRAGEGY